jgi:hypothetical protein
MAASASAKPGDQIMGFDCKDQAASRPDIHFNLDMKRKKWTWENGDTSTLELTDTEARVPNDPLLFNRGLIFSRVLNRTTLVFVQDVMKIDGSLRRRTLYQCQMVQPHLFGQNRKF